MCFVYAQIVMRCFSDFLNEELILDKDLQLIPGASLMHAESFSNLLPYPAELQLDAGLWGAQGTGDHNFIFTGVRPANFHLLTKVANGMYCPNLKDKDGTVS